MGKLSDMLRSSLEKPKNTPPTHFATCCYFFIFAHTTVGSMNPFKNLNKIRLCDCKLVSWLFYGAFFSSGFLMNIKVAEH